MSKYAGEEVLVVRRSLFDSLGAFEGICTEVERYFPVLLDPANNFFLDRAAAELDPSHKQLIPYAIFRHGDRLLHYTRGKSGGEARLHAQGSIGIGGHINPVDNHTDHLGHKTYMNGVEREIREELNIAGNYTQRVAAILNDDLNPVGQVHLGIVHIFELDDDQVTAAEDALANLSFQSIADLKHGPLHDNLETWSRHCIDSLDLG
jgi:predicted NUDIX family phosphoesterase